MLIDVVLEVPGHKSSLAFGLIGPGEGVPVVVMLGRVSHLEAMDRPSAYGRLHNSCIPTRATSFRLSYILSASWRD